MPPVAFFDITTDTQVDCGITRRHFKLRLEPRKATLSDASGVLLVVEDDRTILYPRCDTIPFAANRTWQSRDLREPREFAAFISHACACPRAAFAWVAKPKSARSTEAYMKASSWPGDDYMAGDLLLSRAVAAETPWRYWLVFLDPRFKGFAYFEGSPRQSYSWRATLVNGSKSRPTSSVS